MIAALLGWIAASPSVRIVLKYGGIALAVLLFLFALRRAGERMRRLIETGARIVRYARYVMYQFAEALPREAFAGALNLISGLPVRPETASST